MATAPGSSVDVFQPLFQRAEMMDLCPTVDEVEKSMFSNHRWTPSELDSLFFTMLKMTDVVEKAKKDALLPSLTVLKDQLREQTELYEKLYQATTNILATEPLFAQVSETCKSIKVLGNPRNPVEICPLYVHALSIADEYADHLKRTFEHLKGVTVTVAPTKKVVRLLEKMVLQSDGSRGCSVIMDVVRGMLEVDTHQAHIDALRAFDASPHFRIYKVQSYRYDEYKAGRWLDTKVIAALTSDPNQFKTETQIVHKKMSAARDVMGGHDNYAKFRGLHEAITFAEARRGASLEDELEHAKQALLALVPKCCHPQCDRVNGTRMVHSSWDGKQDSYCCQLCQKADLPRIRKTLCNNLRCAETNGTGKIQMSLDGKENSFCSDQCRVESDRNEVVADSPPMCCNPTCAKTNGTGRRRPAWGGMENWYCGRECCAKHLPGYTGLSFFDVVEPPTCSNPTCAETNGTGRRRPAWDGKENSYCGKACRNALEAHKRHDDGCCAQ